VEDDEEGDYNYNHDNEYEYVYREVNDGANGEQEAIRVPVAQLEKDGAIIFPDDNLDNAIAEQNAAIPEH
jgi:hypothetical protein